MGFGYNLTDFQFKQIEITQIQKLPNERVFISWHKAKFSFLGINRYSFRVITIIGFGFECKLGADFQVFKYEKYRCNGKSFVSICLICLIAR